MKPDPKVDCAKAAIVELGGQEFFVPALALRQARIAVPGLLKLMPRLSAIQARIGAGDALGAALLDKDDVELMIDVVHAGLSRAYPDFSRDDLLDLEGGIRATDRGAGGDRPADGAVFGDGKSAAGGVSDDGPDFDRIVAHYCQMSGEAWTDALEAELTFPRIFARRAFWRDNPPAAILLTALAIGLGAWKPKLRAEPDPVGALRALFPAGRF